jgi:hypothetical protein
MGIRGRGARMHAAASHHISEKCTVQYFPPLLASSAGSTIPFPPYTAELARVVEYFSAHFLHSKVARLVSLRRRGGEATRSFLHRWP